jgi:hypothetical protein
MPSEPSPWFYPWFYIGEDGLSHTVSPNALPSSSRYIPIDSSIKDMDRGVRDAQGPEDLLWYAEMLFGAGILKGITKEIGMSSFKKLSINEMKNAIKNFLKTNGKNEASKKIINSLDDIFSNPSSIKNMTPKEVMEIAEKEGWNITPLGHGSKKGIPFSEGGGLSIRKIGPKGEPTDQYIQWHPGGGHHGSSPYLKVSSGKSGTQRFDN